jgi:glycogen(starch) synthase
MRVLLTTDTIGGVWTFTCELSERLLEMGHAVAVVSFGRIPSQAQSAWTARQKARFNASFYFEASQVPLEWMQENSRTFGVGAELLSRVSREFRAEVVHCSQFCWGALDCRLPKVITAHSDVLSWADSADPSALRGSPWLSRYTAMVQKGLDGADAVIAPTSWMRAALRAHFAVRAPFDVIYNGRTVPQSTTTIERRLSAITAGRLWDKAKALSIIFDINSPLPISVAGEEQFGDALATARPSHVTALGVLDEQQILYTMRQSSIYIATSIYEPFGLAALEAAMCGCAIVARDIPSFHEVWGNAISYFGNAAELENVLAALAADPNRLLRAQRSAHERASHYTGAAMAAEYVRLYGKLISARKKQECVDHAA